MAHALAVNAARLLDEGNYDEAEPLINGLKVEGVAVALNALDAAARAFGGEGYSDRRAIATAIFLLTHGQILGGQKPLRCSP